MLCPVREYDWIPDWDPEVVYTESGIAEKECVFVTGEGEFHATWVITLYDAPKHIEMYKITADVSVAKVTAKVSPLDDGQSAVDISYSLTSLGTGGDYALEQLTPERYEAFMKEWEKQVNHYLATGEKLQG